MRQLEAILLTVLGSVVVGSGAASAAPPASTDQAYAAFVETYLDGLFHYNPAHATRAGFHQYDGELPGYSRKEIEAEIARNRRALQDLAAILKGPLSPENQFDARLLENSIRGDLLGLEDIRMWEKNPDVYGSVVLFSLFVLVQRDFAPIKERVRSLISRERRVPEILRNARANLVSPPEVYTQIAIRQAEFGIQFLSEDLPRAVVAARDPALLAEFREVNQRAIEEFKKFLDYLRADLLPRSRGTFAIGTENFRKKLLYDEMVDTPLARLVEIGEQELRKTQADFNATAQLINPATSPDELLKELSQDHPASQELITETQALLEGLRKFVTSHQIVTIPSPANPRVVETPTFMRVLTFASMDTPGAFEETSRQAFYNVTLPDPKWTEEQKEQHLRFFSRHAIPGTSIHEVFPGHYTQFLWVKHAPTKVRKLLGCSTNAEGWAHYAEQMMLEEGYGEGDPKLLLFQLHAALVRLCRYLVGIRMHTQGMTLEEATAFFEREAHMERVNAEREAMRGTSDPTYLVYTLGKLQILRLREDYQRKVGERFSLKEFHDRFLGFGYPPIKLIREELLGVDSPTL